MKNSHERNHFCGRCMRDRAASYFELWNKDRNRQRTCDPCIDAIKSRRISIEQEIERKAKAKAMAERVTPVMVNASKADDAKKAIEVRRALEEKLELMRIEKENEL
jgi:hypothetical protein